MKNYKDITARKIKNWDMGKELSKILIMHSWIIKTMNGKEAKKNIQW